LSRNQKRRKAMDLGVFRTQEHTGLYVHLAPQKRGEKRSAKESQRSSSFDSSAEGGGSSTSSAVNKRRAGIVKKNFTRRTINARKI